MTDYSHYVHCGEVFRSSLHSKEKKYVFKCIKCRDLFQFEVFVAHFEQNLCELREVTIKEEILDDGCLSGCSKMVGNEDMSGNSIDEVVVNPDSEDCKKDEDVAIGDEKNHVRYKIEISDAEVDPEQQEFESDVSVDDDTDLDDCQYESEDTNVTDETESLMKPKHGNEEEDISSRRNRKVFIKNHGNVVALIKAYKAQTPLWYKTNSFRDKEERQKYLEIVTKELNEKRNLDLHWKQVSSLIRHLLRIYRHNLKEFKDSQTQNTKRRPVWFSKHLQFLQPFIENNFLSTLDLCLPRLDQEERTSILKIYENLPHLWNTGLIEHRCNNKRNESKIEMIKSIETTLGYKVNCETLTTYLKNIHYYFSKKKRETLNHKHLENNGLFQQLFFLLDHVGPFRCSQCDFETNSVFSYKLHISHHDGSMPFKCSQCDKEFRAKSAYDIHARRHLDDFQYVCQECDRKFLTYQTLKVHMSFHTNVRDCICKTCGKAFKTINILKVHELTHSDVRKYNCTICSKSFKTQFRLTRHVRTHARKLNKGNK